MVKFSKCVYNLSISNWSFRFVSVGRIATKKRSSELDRLSQLLTLSQQNQTSFNSDDIYHVTPPEVSAESIHIYENYVNRSIYGAADPDQRTLNKYEEYAKCQLGLFSVASHVQWYRIFWNCGASLKNPVQEKETEPYQTEKRTEKQKFKVSSLHESQLQIMFKSSLYIWRLFSGPPEFLIGENVSSQLLPTHSSQNFLGTFWLNSAVLSWAKMSILVPRSYKNLEKKDLCAEIHY